jgi:beta-lactam-binding protein with PASTA domain
VDVITFPEVPDLNGLLLDEARQKLSGAGLQLGKIQKVAAAGRRLDTVVGQSHPAGQRLRLGTRVDLRVTGESTVPDVRGMSSFEAGIALGLAGLKVGETSEEEVTGARPGRVARQSPSPGTRIPPGTAVSLVIVSRQAPQPSKPSEPREPSKPSERRESQKEVCTVPDIRHVSVERAPGVLQERRLQLGSVRRVEGGSARVTQNPEPGAQVRCGSSVDLVIYSVPSGKPAGPNPKIQRTVCTVPDILSGGPKSARKILEAEGLKLGQEEQRIEGPPYQNPKAGAHVPCGSAVNVSW